MRSDFLSRWIESTIMVAWFLASAGMVVSGIGLGVTSSAWWFLLSAVGFLSFTALVSRD